MLKPRQLCILLLVASNIYGAWGAWFCRDEKCSSPVSRGKTGYKYNPLPDAIANGYLPVEANLDAQVFRVSNEPDILDIEVGGKRGFVPRTVVDITEDFMQEKNEFVVVDEGRIPYEQDPVVLDKAPPADLPVANAPESTNSVTDVASLEKEKPIGSDIKPAAQVVEADKLPAETVIQKTDIAPDAEEAWKAMQNVIAPVVAEEDKQPEPVKGPVVTNTGSNLASANQDKGTVDQKLEVGVAVPQEVISDQIKIAAEPLVAAVPAVDVLPNLPTTKPVNVTAPPGEIVTKLVPVDEITKPVVPESNVKDEPASPSTQSSPVAMSEKPAQITLPQQGLVEKEVSPSPVPNQVERPTTNTSPTVSSGDSLQKVAEQVLAQALHSTPDVKLPSSQNTPAVEAVPEVSSAPEVAAQLRGPTGALSMHDLLEKAAEAKVVPTLSVKDSVPEVPLDTAKIPIENVAVNRPQPTVVFQQQDPFAGLPSFYSKTDFGTRFNTKTATHGHHHHHHGHDHGHGSHEHHHGHDHDSHDHHGHDHGDHKHDHKHEDGHNPGLSGEMIPSEQSGQNSTTETTEIAVQENQAAQTSVISPPEYVSPENATQSPVDYTQLVQDRIDGKTVPGLLNDGLKYDPSAGIPTPPDRLDPSTATEPPRIPGLSSDSLPVSEMQAAIDSQERYNRRSSRGAHHYHVGHSHDEPETNLLPAAETPENLPESIEGACAARSPGDLSSDLPCETVAAPETETQMPAPEYLEAKNSTVSFTEKLSQQLHFVTGLCCKSWTILVLEFETVTTGGLRLAGLILFGLTTLVSLMAVESHRRVRRTVVKGFEEYDHKKESEVLTLRAQVQNLLKLSQDQTGNNKSPVAVAPPPQFMPRSVVADLNSRGPCTECDTVKHSLATLKRAVADNEQALKGHRETHADLLSKNNEAATELRLISKERDDLKVQLEILRQRLVDTEKRQYSPVAQVPGSQQESEITFLRQRLEQVESERARMAEENQRTNFSAKELSDRNFVLQTERDESASNVRLLKQMLAEKEEEIRKIRSAEAAGGATSSRELHEKTEEVRAYKKQLKNLHDELDTMKRDRESQMALRCQSFRSAADKAQRESLLARSEAILLRQQLEELCRKYGEQMPAVMIPQIANGAATPPGLIPTPPLLYAGQAFPPGPPPPTFEAFRQVLSQHAQHASGNTSPRSPHLEQELRREKRGPNRSKTQDFNPRNGRDGTFDNSDDERKRDRSHR